MIFQVLRIAILTGCAGEMDPIDAEFPELPANDNWCQWEIPPFPWAH